MGGIGTAICQRLHKDGYKVIAGCGPSRDHAKWIAEQKALGYTFHASVGNVADWESTVSAFKQAKEEHGVIDILVNNAGIQRRLRLDGGEEWAPTREEIAVNFEAPVHLTTLFAPHLLALPRAAVVNVTSGLAFVPLTKVPVYSATKAFLHSFTLSLRELVRARNIEVIELIPPALNTELGGTGRHDHSPPVDGFIEAVFTQLAQGKTSVTYGFTEALSHAGDDVLGPIFNRLNPGA